MSRTRLRIRLLTAVALAASLTAAVVSGTAAEADAVAAKRSAPRDAVLLVHGFDGSAASWHGMRDRLRATGHRDRDVAAISYDSEASMVTVASQIAVAVDDLLTRTRAKRVDLVSHSMGALASRYYVSQLGGDTRVDAWVSLAGANRGTYWAYGCALLLSCQDMLPGSLLLTTLTPDVPSDGAVRFATWWSPCDPVIMPTSAATLVGAENVETACIGHSELKTDPVVFAQVDRFLRGRHRSR